MKYGKWWHMPSYHIRIDTKDDNANVRRNNIATDQSKKEKNK